MSLQARPSRSYLGLLGRAARLWPVDAFLPHTYTRKPLVNDADDPYGNMSKHLGDPIENLPCQFQERELAGRDIAGNPTLVYQLTLYVPNSDALAAGDEVSMVRDRRTGEIVDLGPARVDWMRSVQPWGPVIYNEALLSRQEGTG